MGGKAAHAESNSKLYEIPMVEKSLGGHQYYVTFIDDHSRKTLIYLLKSEDEVFEKFQEFKAKVENLTKRKIKTLRSSNGGEYTSKEIVQELRGSWQFLTILNIMVWLKGRSDQLKNVLEPCYMTKNFLSSYGEKHL